MINDPDQLRRRLVAARTIRNVSQAELNAQAAGYGLGKHEAARVERGELEWRQKHTDAFRRVLDLSDRWFNEPDDDVILGLKPAAGITPEFANDLLAQLAASAALAPDPTAQQTTTDRAGTGRPAPGREGGVE